MTQNDPSESESEWEAIFGVARGGIKLGPVVTTTRANGKAVGSLRFLSKEGSFGL